MLINQGVTREGYAPGDSAGVSFGRNGLKHFSPRTVKQREIKMATVMDQRHGHRWANDHRERYGWLSSEDVRDLCIGNGNKRNVPARPNPTPYDYAPVDRVIHNKAPVSLPACASMSAKNGIISMGKKQRSASCREKYNKDKIGLSRLKPYQWDRTSDGKVTAVGPDVLYRNTFGIGSVDATYESQHGMEVKLTRINKLLMEEDKASSSSTIDQQVLLSKLEELGIKQKERTAKSAKSDGDTVSPREGGLLYNKVQNSIHRVKTAGKVQRPLVKENNTHLSNYAYTRSARKRGRALTSQQFLELKFAPALDILEPVSTPFEVNGKEYPSAEAYLEYVALLKKQRSHKTNTASASGRGRLVRSARMGSGLVGRLSAALPRNPPSTPKSGEVWTSKNDQTKNFLLGPRNVTLPPTFKREPQDKPKVDNLPEMRIGLELETTDSAPESNVLGNKNNDVIEDENVISDPLSDNHGTDKGNIGVSIVPDSVEVTDREDRDLDSALTSRRERLTVDLRSAVGDPSEIDDLSSNRGNVNSQTGNSGDM